MKGQIFNPGQPQTKESFDHSQDSIEEAIRERMVDFCSPGILEDSHYGGESIPFEINPDGGLNVRVGSGSAVAAHDVDRPESIDGADPIRTGAERILVPVADTSGSPANIYARSPGAGPNTGTGTGPFTESADGLGGWTATPQSTKTRSIPLVNGSLNRLWISYLDTVDTSVTSLHKVQVSNILYPKGEDGYDIVVNQIGTPPGGDVKYEFLGAVDLTASPAFVTLSMISHPGRRFARIRPKRVALRFDPVALKPTSIVNPSTMTVEDHANSVGTGVITPNNVHGLTLTDLGITQDIDLKSHRIKDHSNGLVIPSEGSTTSAMYPRTDTTTPVPADAAMVFMKKMTASETILVNGTVYNDAGVDSVVKLAGPSGAGAVGDYYVSFGTTHIAGVYGIVFKESGTIITVEKRLAPFSFNPDTDYLVATVDWSGTGFINPIAPGVQDDNRVFGTLGRRNLQESAVETLQIKDLNVTTPKLADGAVTTIKLFDDAVESTKLAEADGTSGQNTATGTGVKTTHIQDLAVTEVKLGDDSVASAKIDQADGSTGQDTTMGYGVKESHIQDDAIVTSKLLDDAVSSAKIAEADGTTSQNTAIGLGVKTDHLQDGAVTTPKLDPSLQALLASGIPPGAVFAFAGGSLPTGWLHCDGALIDSISNPQFAALFVIIGTTWGGTGASSFRVPDLRGVFIRGWNDTASGSFSDPSSGSRTNKYTGGAVGNAVGSYQGDMIGDHTHSNVSVIGHDGGGGVSTSMSAYSPSAGFPEARPRNAYVMYMIKF
jgi:microcystin-dependent protein